MQLAELGKRVAAAREAVGMHPLALAQAAGVDRSTILRLEAGQLSPKAVTLAAIADALGTTIDALLAPAPKSKKATA